MKNLLTPFIFLILIAAPSALATYVNPPSPTAKGGTGVVVFPSPSPSGQVVTATGTGFNLTSVTALGVSTDWTTTTGLVPNNFGTVSASNYQYRRNGDSLEALMTFTAGSSLGGGNASITLPFTIDSTKMPTNSFGSIVGIYYRGQNSTTQNIYSSFAGVVFYDGSDTSKVYFAQQVSSTALNKDTGSNLFTASEPVTVRFIVPISGWSSSNIGTGQGAVYLLAKGQPTGGASSGAVIVFPTVVKDTNSAYNNSTGEFTAPVTGAYQVCASNNQSSAQDIFVYVNGTQDQLLKNSNGISAVFGCALVVASAGQTIDIRPVGGGIGATGASSSYSINLISGNGSGNLTISGNGSDHAARAMLSAICTSGTCSLTNQSGVSSVVFNSTGNYTVNFTAGVFSAATTCNVGSLGQGAAFGVCRVSSVPSASTATVDCRNLSNSQQNDAFSIQCQGPQ